MKFTCWSSRAARGRGRGPSCGVEVELVRRAQGEAALDDERAFRRGAGGLELWHRQGPAFGLGPAAATVSAGVAYGSLVVCLGLVALAFAVGGE
jgi:hypothetical protein